MDLRELDAQPAQLLDRVVEPAKRHHLVALVDQEIAAPAVLLEEHDPFPGQGGIGDDVGRRDLPCRLPVPNLLALHCLPVSCVERRNYRIIGSRGEKTQRAAIAISMPGTASSRRMLRISHSVSGGALSCGEGMVRAT